MDLDFALFSLEKKTKRLSTDSVDIMDSERRLTDRDISVVANEVGVSWRVLGLRLNFTPETLDAIAQSASVVATDHNHEKVRVAARKFTDS